MSVPLCSIARVLPVLLLGACTSYVARPLPDMPALAAGPAAVVLDSATLPFRALRAHRFDPDDGLDSVEVTMLAVANNAQLRSARDAAGVSHMQAFAAGLLPDPQFGFSLDHPTGGTPGASNAFGVSLGYDLTALLMRSSQRAIAVADERRVDLELLWQEWQVVSDAKLLFARLGSTRRLLAHERAVAGLLRERSLHSQQALQLGNLSRDSAAADLILLEVLEHQIDDAERSQLQNGAALNGLLGIAALTPLQLVGEVEVATFEPISVRATQRVRLAQRPDLQALRAGYESEEARLRAAVLGQFPAFGIALNQARDNAGVQSTGFALTLSLPILNANRGAIAVEQASRQKLFDEYQARLGAAESEIDLALANRMLLAGQLARVLRAVQELSQMAAQAQAAYQDRNLPGSDYLRLQLALLDKQVEAEQLRETMTEQTIALEALLGPIL